MELAGAASPLCFHSTCPPSSQQHLASFIPAQLPLGWTKAHTPLVAQRLLAAVMPLSHRGAGETGVEPSSCSAMHTASLGMGQNYTSPTLVAWPLPEHAFGGEGALRALWEGACPLAGKGAYTASSLAFSCTAAPHPNSAPMHMHKVTFPHTHILSLLV